MAGYIAEFFGYRADDRSEESLQAAAKRVCPFINSQCTKILARDHDVAGVCSIRQMTKGTPIVICCPVRLYAEDYRLLFTISEKAFKQQLRLYAGRAAVVKAKTEGGAIAVFGKRWGGELRLPQRKGSGSYFVDWVLAKLDGNGELVEFTAVEVQTIDTTNNYRTAREALLDGRKVVSDDMGLNWENVSKRIIPQIIYKGQVLQREELCRTGLYFVCPQPVYERVLGRLGGKEKLQSIPVQPASMQFIAYDYDPTVLNQDGIIRPLRIIDSHCTAVYKVQEAFSTQELPAGNVYRDAIRRSLYE